MKTSGILYLAVTEVTTAVSEEHATSTFSTNRSRNIGANLQHYTAPSPKNTLMYFRADNILLGSRNSLCRPNYTLNRQLQSNSNQIYCKKSSFTQLRYKFRPLLPTSSKICPVLLYITVTTMHAANRKQGHRRLIQLVRHIERTVTGVNTQS
jgi:hypothetical protein